MLGWGARGQAPWCLQGGCSRRQGPELHPCAGVGARSPCREQFLPLQAALQKPPRSRVGERRHQRGSEVPGSGRKEQGRATGLSRTAPALEGTRCGVQGDWSRAGSTPGLADPRAGVCRGKGGTSWGGTPQGPADPGAAGCQDPGQGRDLPSAPGWGHRGAGGVTGAGGGRRSEVGPGEGAPLPAQGAAVCGRRFLPEPELSQSRRLARARLPAASRRPGPPPAARLGRQRRDGA